MPFKKHEMNTAIWHHFAGAFEPTDAQVFLSAEWEEVFEGEDMSDLQIKLIWDCNLIVNQISEIQLKASQWISIYYPATITEQEVNDMINESKEDYISLFKEKMKELKKIMPLRINTPKEIIDTIYTGIKSKSGN